MKIELVGYRFILKSSAGKFMQNSNAPTFFMTKKNWLFQMEISKGFKESQRTIVCYLERKCVKLHKLHSECASTAANKTRFL